MSEKIFEKIMNLVSLIIKIEYEKNDIGKIDKLLGDIFETDEVKLERSVSFDDYKKEENTLYIPINVNGEVRCFYSIKNVKNAFSYLIIDSITKILSEMYTNVFVRLPKYTENNIDLNTNLYNQNAFFVFKNECQLSELDCVGCVFVDINGMNEINNDYGHVFGDKIICKVADALKDIFFDEKVFRIGGDEFIIITTKMDESLFYERLEKLYERTANDSLNVSIGAVIKSKDLNIDELIEEADKMMYQEKEEYYKREGMTLRKSFGKRTSRI